MREWGRWGRHRREGKYKKNSQMYFAESREGEQENGRVRGGGKSGEGREGCWWIRRRGERR